MPSLCALLMMRHAISPRLAMRIFLNMHAPGTGGPTPVLMIGKNIGRGRGKPPCREGPATRSETANQDPAASRSHIGTRLCRTSLMVRPSSWDGSGGAPWGVYQVETVLLILAIAA